MAKTRSQPKATSQTTTERVPPPTEPLPPARPAKKAQTKPNRPEPVEEISETFVVEKPKTTKRSAPKKDTAAKRVPSRAKKSNNVEPEIEPDSEPKSLPSVESNNEIEMKVQKPIPEPAIEDIPDVEPELEPIDIPMTTARKGAKSKKAPVAKKITAKEKAKKLEQEEELEESRPPKLDVKPEMDFNKFQFSKVIDESTTTKCITLLGTYEGDEAVVRLEKTTFDEEDVKTLFQDQIRSDKDFANDIYASYKLNVIDPERQTNCLKATVVWPANQSVLDKYTHSEHILFCETQDHYLKVVEPFIANKVKNEKDYNQWIYNILEGKTETERVIYNDADKDSGFVLVPDLKCLGDVKDLHFVAICHRRDIRSLRDLNDKHLILLKNILTKGTEAIKNKYKKFSGQLRTYIHYQPSFYHFHVHFKVVDPSDYQATDRDNLLSTVISNITLMGDYYKRSTLTYPLSLSSPLYQALKQAKRV